MTGRDPICPAQSHNPRAYNTAEVPETEVDRTETGAQRLSPPHHSQALLGEVVVDVGRFHGQVAGRIEGIAFILWGFIGGLTHCQEVCKSGGMVTHP